MRAGLRGPSQCGFDVMGRYRHSHRESLPRKGRARATHVLQVAPAAGCSYSNPSEFVDILRSIMFSNPISIRSGACWTLRTRLRRTFGKQKMKATTRGPMIDVPNGVDIHSASHEAMWFTVTGQI